ncbi:MAG TPA: hypothetical protein VHS96_09990 [Bacteroidia bacterium]|nr:hypothetical protein [Bacteroidia bacterium]
MLGFSQGSPRKVTFSKFTLTENVNPGNRGVTGLELQFDASFNWEETDFFKRDFNLSFRMEQAGNVVLHSDKMQKRLSSMMVQSEKVGGKPGMAAHGKAVFIPYLEIPLESGLQKADLIFSVSNGEGTYTDCFKTSITWQHKKIVRHNLNAQQFDFKELMVDYAAKEFATGAAGIGLSAEIGLKYGPEECVESSYELACVIKSGGKQVFDSRTAASSDKTRSVAVEVFEGKPQSKVRFFINYYDLKMDGPAEAEIAFFLIGAEGGPKQVFSKTILLEAPVKYNFEEQVFTLKKVEVTPAVVDGVQGIAVDYACAFKYHTILRNPEKGQYYFYLALLDGSGKLAIDPARAPKHAAGTSHLLDAQLPSATNTIGQGRLFIPYYMLHTAAGPQQLKYALMVSDISLGTKFPVIGQGTVSVTKPEEQQYWVAMEQLDMIDANYDVEFIPPGSRLPELQYLLCVGEDAFFESEYTRNSLSAVPGSALLRISKGDKIGMKLYDIDSGFFNASDLQGKWDILYEGKADPFLYEVHNQGQVVTLRVKVDRRD